MFDQQLYDQEVDAPQLEPGDLFYKYEIKNWDLTPRLYRILSLSAVANILALVVIGSSGMLTTRGCDSPFVGRVCQVLDTVYVGSVLFNTEREYADMDYTKTELEDADIVWIDQTGVTPPLTYPAGYFQLANPEQNLANDPLGGALPPGFIAPGIPSSPNFGTGGGLLDTTPIMPKANPNAIEGDLPSTGPLGEVNDSSPGPRNRRKNNGQGPLVGSSNTNQNVPLPDGSMPPPDPTKVAEEKPVNSRPFKDLANEVNAMRDKKELNLDAEFSVTAKGKLNTEGKLDGKTFKFVTAASSDPKMVDVVKRSVEAFNDSGMLQYLEQLSGRDLNLAIAQDRENVTGEVRTQVDGDTRARGLATAFKFGIGLAIAQKEEKIKKLQEANNPDDTQSLQNTMDELELLKQTDVIAEGKDVVVKFKSPKEAIHNLILRKLDAQAKELNKESGSNQPGLSENAAKK